MLTMRRGTKSTELKRFKELEGEYHYMGETHSGGDTMRLVFEAGRTRVCAKLNHHASAQSKASARGTGDSPLAYPGMSIPRAEIAKPKPSRQCTSQHLPCRVGALADASWV